MLGFITVNLDLLRLLLTVRPSYFRPWDCQINQSITFIFHYAKVTAGYQKNQ